MAIVIDNPSQAQTAEWMGYPSVANMNADHDSYHARLCAWLGIPSASLKIARGEPVTSTERERADYEEQAVLHLQRFVQQSRNMGVI